MCTWKKIFNDSIRWNYYKLKYSKREKHKYIYDIIYINISLMYLLLKLKVIYEESLIVEATNEA